VPTTQRLRRDVADLVDEADSDLSALWRQIDTAGAAAEALNDILPALIDAYGTSASLVAAEWYDEVRAERDVRGPFEAIPAEIPRAGTPELVGWALNEATDMLAFQSLILGGMQRRIANHSRLTITRSATADRQARGWKRVGSGGCDFCSMLLGRGAVYTAATADFEAHDGCQCSAAPDF
jgi:hypothetical protein